MIDGSGKAIRKRMALSVLDAANHDTSGAKKHAPEGHMLSAKDELAHAIAGMSEAEAEIALDIVGEADEDADKAHAAAELLKVAARLLYRDGRTVCVQAGEQIDAILAALLPLINATGDKL